MSADDFPMDIDLDEDLFDFDDTLLSAGDTLADLDAALDVTMDTVSEMTREQPAPAPSTSFTPPASPAPLSPRQVEEGIARRADSTKNSSPSDDPESAASATPTGRAARLTARLTASPVLALAVLGSLAMNVVLVLYAVSALSAVRTLAVGQPTVAAAEAPAQPNTDAQQLPDLGGAGAPGEPAFLAALEDTDQLIGEGEHALNRARAALDGGEFERARQVLSGLLAVADRIPVESRRDIEARARFMLADTWRLEADAHESLLARAALELDREGL